ncbi:MAG TPA: ankyrin repeat domain-containing protein [Longimicrobium sp.]|nr:ankyrin repeat domain-containing protein [Longimicrobium sp.]
MSAIDGLLEALKAGDVGQVESLLAAEPSLAEARKDGVSLLLLALYHQKPQVAEAFARRRSALDVFEAAALGRVERLREVLQAQPELANAHAPDGFTALGLAAFFGQPEAVGLLLERGAQANTASRNGLRVTPLHSAVARRSVESVHLLLRAGADPNARQQGGYTPLHGAAAEGDAGLVRLLLGQGADARAVNDKGETPADLARQKGHAEVARLL